jgi:hypothetical protein
MSRLGIRLAPDRVAAFQERIETLVEDLFAADDPAGEPYGFFVGLHRRREDDPVVTPGRPRRRKPA